MQTIRAKPKWKVDFYSKLFLFIASIECLLLLIGTIYCYLLQPDLSIKDLSYSTVISILFILGIFYFAFDSILSESKLQLYSAFACHSIFTLAGLFYYYHGYKHHSTASDNNNNEQDIYNMIIIIELILVCLCQIIYLFIIPKAGQSFGYRLISKVGADYNLQKCYEYTQIFFTLLKFDLFISSILLLYSSFYLYNNTHLEAVAIGSGYIISFIFWLIGFRSIQAESHPLINVFLVFSCIEPIFIIYKVSEIYNNNDENSARGFFRCCTLFMYSYFIISIYYYM